MSDFLTPEELAQALQVPRSWVMAAAKRGELAHLKFGRYTRFTVAQVESTFLGAHVRWGARGASAWSGTSTATAPPPPSGQGALAS